VRIGAVGAALVEVALAFEEVGPMLAGGVVADGGPVIGETVSPRWSSTIALRIPDATFVHPASRFGQAVTGTSLSGNFDSLSSDEP
jgi:hypothetical protein